MDGIPYPGTFIIDDQGVIRAKLFYDGYKTRHGAQEIIEAARDLDEAASP
jgi:peroxiredoxin